MDGRQVLQIGSLVNIERANKQIHKAYVAEINEQVGYVNVEWRQNDQIRAKDIELSTIKSLNPNLIIFPQTEVGQENMSVSLPDEFGDSTTLGHDDVPTQSFLIPVNRSRLSAIAPFTAKPKGGAVRSRRTSVVKEIEKIKENREERRQRQAQERAKKGGHTKNPNAEFLNMVLDFRQDLQIYPLIGDEMPVEEHHIVVCVRKRPLNSREISRKEVDVITVPSKNQLILHEPKNKVDLTKYLVNQTFRFDFVFDETCSNEIVYKLTARPLVKTIFEGGFSTCFAYGQTGSGKTHTMGGDIIGKERHCQNGIYAMAAKDVFELIDSPEYRPMGFVVSASFFEIYSGKVYDLLKSKAGLKIMEDARQQVQIIGLTQKIVSTCVDVLRLIMIGNQNRSSGQTSANAHSSRSHAIFQLILHRGNNLKHTYGKFSLIDLAGNERGADTSTSDKNTRIEGAEINKSLLALKECIRAMGRKGAHLPFRVSKLTQVLKDSFVGLNSRTCMIAMISPGSNSCEHSLNTLRYADRVKELRYDDPQANQEDIFYDNNEKRFEESAVMS